MANTLIERFYKYGLPKGVSDPSLAVAWVIGAGLLHRKRITRGGPGSGPQGGSGGDSSSSASIEADEEISPGSIVPKNGVRNEEFFDSLVNDMEENGWSGRPVLVMDNGDGSYSALTGSHRSMAAEKAGIDVPVVVIPSEFSSDINLGDDDEGVLSNLKSLSKQNPSLKKAFDLMHKDVNDTTVNADTFKRGVPA